MRIRMMFAAAVAALSLAVVACGGGNKAAGGGGGATSPPPAGASLYDRLGGKDNIVKVVDEFVTTIVADPRIAVFFKNADTANLRKQLVEQICEASGGPCKYAGKDMKTAHTGMNVKGEHFDALVDDLVKVLDKFGVPEKEKGELLGALGPLKSEIVTP
jgi:hemoglobin